MRGSSPGRASGRSSATASRSRPPPPTTPTSTSELILGLRGRARELGFAELRITEARVAEANQHALRRAIARGHHGDMGWLAATLARRRTPEAMWPAAKTALVLAMNYGPAADPLGSLAARERGVISVYAQGDDYHDVIKGRLKQLAQWLVAKAGGTVKVFVDTAPLMEKPLAEGAGVGWQGKHTNLVSRHHGSWLFLGVILTDLALPLDPPERDHCGGCRRCLDICPTDAFPAPYRLDARRCISYLTIEHPGPIPLALRPAMGNRIYGCDDCLAVCPWNKFASRAAEVRLHARNELAAPALGDLAALDASSFRALFKKSPIRRIGHARFVRNVLIALGNSGAPTLAPLAERHLDDPIPLVRGAAVWALGRLLGAASLRRVAARRMTTERDAGVRREWRLAAASNLEVRP